MSREKQNIGFAIVLAALLGFAVLADGAYDIWAATIVHGLVMVTAVCLLIIKGWGKNSPGLRLPLWPFALFVIAAFYASFRQAVNPGESLLALKDWAAAFLIFYIAANIFSSEKVISAFMLSLLPLFFIQLPFLLKQNTLFRLGFGYQDPYGTLVNANVFTAFQLLWIHPLWERFRQSWAEGRPHKWLWGTSFLVCLVNLALARSVAGWALLILTLPILLSAHRLKTISKNNLKALGTIIFILVFLAGILLAIKFNRVLRTGQDLSNRPYTNRVIWWESGLLMLKDHPWLGVGLGNFPSSYLAYKTGQGIHTLHAHSLPIKFLAETGLLGFLAIVTFFIGWSGLLVKRKESFSEKAPFITALLLFLTFNSITIGIEFLANVLALVIFMGLVLGGETGRKIHPRKSWLLVVSVALISLLPDVIMPFFASQDVKRGQVLFEKRDIEGALASFKNAAETDSRSSEAEKGWARTLYERFLTNGDAKDLEEAIVHQQAALRENQLSGKLWFELSGYLKAADRKEEAIHAAEKSVRYHKTNEKYQQNLDWLRE